MWYIFPQFKGLAKSETSQFYSIQHINEAKNYLEHEILGSRLKEITKELLSLPENNATNILGSPDDLKLKSSMTLFAHVDNSNQMIFQKVLDKFFNGQKDNLTLTLIKE